MMETNILIIDDDVKLLDLLTRYLTDYHYKVLSAKTGEDGLKTLGAKQVDIIILDIMLPGKDGFEICRHIRQESTVPIIMLTARGDSADRVVGLELGADDYLPKPFNPRELLARIKAVLRRQKDYDQEKNSGSGSILIKGKFTLNTDRRAVTKNDVEIELTTVEFDILHILMKNSGVVLSRDRLLDLARGKDYMPFDRSIDVHISRLRQKIEDDPRNPVFIKTVWGIGYVFTVES